MSEEDPGHERANFIKSKRSNAANSAPFEANAHSVPEAVGRCQEFFFRRSVEVGEAVEDTFAVRCSRDMLLCNSRGVF